MNNVKTKGLDKDDILLYTITAYLSFLQRPFSLSYSELLYEKAAAKCTVKKVIWLPFV